MLLPILTTALAFVAGFFWGSRWGFDAGYQKARATALRIMEKGVLDNIAHMIASQHPTASPSHRSPTVH